MARPVSKGARKAPKRKSSASVKSTAKKAAPKKAAKKAAPPAKRPPEIDRKRWAKLGEPQRKRYERFYRLHPGQPLYRARGKGKGEHLTRKQRQAERMAALGDRQHYRGQDQGARPAAEIVASYQALVADKGDKAFSELERAIRTRKKGEGRITSAEFGWDWEWEDYDGNDAELFYN